MIYQPALRDNLRKYIVQAAAAVLYLHLKGIVHRKIKLENFFLYNESQVCVSSRVMSYLEILYFIRGENAAD